MRKKGGNFEENRSVQENRLLSFDSLEEGRRGGNDRYQEKSAPLPVISDPRPGGEKRRNQRNREPSDFEEPVEQAALEGADHRQGQRNEMPQERQRRSSKVIQILRDQMLLPAYLEIKQCQLNILNERTLGLKKLIHDADEIEVQMTQMGCIAAFLWWKQTQLNLKDSKTKAEKEQQDDQILIDELALSEACTWAAIVKNISKLASLALPADVILTPKDLARLFTTLERFWPEKQERVYEAYSPKELEILMEEELKGREEYIRDYTSLLEKDVLDFKTGRDHRRSNFQDSMNLLIAHRENEKQLRAQIAEIETSQMSNVAELPEINSKDQGSNEKESKKSQGQQSRPLRHSDQRIKAQLQKQIAEATGKQQATYEQLRGLMCCTASEEFLSSARRIMDKLRYTHADLVNRRDIAEAKLLEYFSRKLERVRPEDIATRIKQAEYGMDKLFKQQKQHKIYNDRHRNQGELKEKHNALTLDIKEIREIYKRPSTPLQKRVSDTEFKLSRFDKMRLHDLLIKFISMITALIKQSPAGLKEKLEMAKKRWKKWKEIQMKLNTIDRLLGQSDGFASTFEDILNEAKQLAGQQESEETFDISLFERTYYLYRHASEQLQAAEEILLEADKLYLEAEEQLQLRLGEEK